MFIGHFALGLAARRAPYSPSLGTTFLAAQFLDLLWPPLLLAGVERVAIEPGNTAANPLLFVYYPYSHSLVAAALWATLFAGVYYALKKNARGALLLAALVLSHWVLDLVTHRPDLPLSLSDGTKVGLGLWNYKAWSLVVEALLFAGGVYLYATATAPRNRWGSWALWSFVVFIGVIYGLNAVGDPPPSAKAIGYVGLAQWLFIGWGYWIDRHRTSLRPQRNPRLHPA